MVAREVEPALSTSRDQVRDQTQDQTQNRDQIQNQDQLRDNSNDNGAVSVPADCTVNPPQNWVRYTIRLGDTLSGLAQRTNARLGDLALANCIRDPRMIMVGADIFLPSQPSPALGNTNANSNGNFNDNSDDHGNGNFDDRGNDNADDHGNGNGNDNADDHGGNSGRGGGESNDD
jgi:LysM repeat protein